MCSTIVGHAKCTCSAIFETNDDLERHLDEAAEQQRFREQLIRDLQAEAKRYQAQAHERASDITSSERIGDHHLLASVDTSSLPCQHVCPSCPRSNPFKTKQRLRRHFEQHVECHEVCVCCTRVFRFVREFQRHAEKCTDESKRKMTYMKNTCDELRELSDTQLDRMLARGKKRPWDEVGIEASELDENDNGNGRRPPRQVETRHRPAQNALDGSTVADLSTHDAPVNDTGSCLTGSARETTGLGPAQQHDLASGLPEDGMLPLDLLASFDAPLMHIMNGVPLFMNQWVMDGQDGDATSNDAPHHLPPEM